MSKLNLKKILYCSEVPKLIIYFDSWDVCGQHVIWSHLKSHLNDKKNIHYLCYSRKPSQISNKLGEDQELLKFYDVYSDPLQWNGDCSDHLDARKPITSLIDLPKYKEGSNLVVVIDKISCAANYLSEINLLRNIQALKNSNSVQQVILYCSENVLCPHFTLALQNICDASLSLRNATPLTCHVLLKKKNGKVLKSVEEFSINSDLQLEFTREHVALEMALKTATLNDSSDIAFETSFNLSLTENQKEAKNKLILPHTRVQLTGGHIHYVPDAEDDWDDEDPDDDLEI